MSFDLAKALRRIKPQKIKALARRRDDELTFIDHNDLVGPPLLLDSCVYIDILQANAPYALKALLAVRICHHSAVGLAELTNLFGRLDPRRADTSPTLAQIAGVIAEDIPSHRLTEPNRVNWGVAGILAGVLFRTGRFTKGQEQDCLNDALIFLQARQFGHTVLTRNFRQFDLLNQILPDGKVLFYRKSESAAGSEP